jgi:ATP-dependent exoDNAse (exonuclease V) alpha subunit
MQRILVRPTTAYFTINGMHCSRTQLPLQNAFALTVHKTQGLTLDQIIISLDEGMFSPGHAYTALSRVRCWENVDITALSMAAFNVDQDALMEYQRLEGDGV